jgi:hypothetical protein
MFTIHLSAPRHRCPCAGIYTCEDIHMRGLLSQGGACLRTCRPCLGRRAYHELRMAREKSRRNARGAPARQHSSASRTSSPCCAVCVALPSAALLEEAAAALLARISGDTRSIAACIGW